MNEDLGLALECTDHEPETCSKQYCLICQTLGLSQKSRLLGTRDRESGFSRTFLMKTKCIWEERVLKLPLEWNKDPKNKTLPMV